jgi:hypothetical protein
MDSQLICYGDYIQLSMSDKLFFYYPTVSQPLFIERPEATHWCIKSTLLQILPGFSNSSKVDFNNEKHSEEIAQKFSQKKFKIKSGDLINLYHVESNRFLKVYE